MSNCVACVGAETILYRALSLLPEGLLSQAKFRAYANEPLTAANSFKHQHLCLEVGGMYRRHLVHAGGEPIDVGTSSKVRACLEVLLATSFRAARRCRGRSASLRYELLGV